MKSKIFFALTVAAALIGATLIFRFASDSSTKARTAAGSLVQDIIAQSVQEDADDDGLKNWEEALYKTDPDNRDSDRDGTSDGDEVKEGRDPAVPGPDDKIESTEADTATIDKRDPSPTDIFSYDLFAEYIEAKRAGKEITPETAAEIANTILSQEYATTAPEFDVKNLTVINDSTLVALKAYGNELGAVLTAPLPEGAEPELMILERLGQGGSITEKDLQSLAAAHERYTQMKRKLVSMAVPSVVAHMHAKIIDSIALLDEGVVGIRDLSTDPIGSYPRIGNYGSGIDLLELLLLDLKAFFVQKGIIFSSVEAGYVFTQ